MIFNRHTIGTEHSICSHLRYLAASDVVSERAVAANLQFDHRVNELRQGQFVTTYFHPTGPSVEDSMNLYRKDRVFRRTPDFANPALNHPNILPTDGNVRLADDTDDCADCLVNLDVRLVRILPLNALRDVFECANAMGLSEFRDYSRDIVDDPNAVHRKLTESMKDSRDELIKQICIAHNARCENQAESTFFPGWVSLWDTVEPFYQQAIASPSFLVDSFGLDLAGSVPCWAAVLRYTVRDAGRLARPTQLEAGWNGRHFPSPPDKLPFKGGCVMPLGDFSITEPLVPEFVHPWIRLRPEFFFEILELSSSTSHDLSHSRNRHRRRLEQYYPANSAGWLVDP